MQRIQKAPETMTARERVRRTFEFEKTDRVTIGYEANAAIHARLCRELGVANNDMESVYQALGVDYRGISAPYVGPELYKAPPERRVDPLEGCVIRWVAHETGGYWDFCDFPLEGADDADFDAFPVPNPDDFDYDQAREQARGVPAGDAVAAGRRAGRHAGLRLAGRGLGHSAHVDDQP